MCPWGAHALWSSLRLRSRRGGRVAVVTGGRPGLGVLLAGLLAVACGSAAPSAAHDVAPCGGAVQAPAAVTVDDPALGVTWLGDADLAATDTFNVSGISCDGSMEFATARTWVRAMNHADYLGHQDWTLPITPTPSTDAGCSGYNKAGGGHFGINCSKSPLASLYDSFGLPAPDDTAVAIPDATTGPFQDFQPYLYWTNQKSKDQLGGKRCCQSFSFNTGRTSSNTDLFSMYVLPIIQGNVFRVRVVAGSSSVLYPTDGGQAVFQVVPGTSGITWLADADLAQKETFNVSGSFGNDGSMTHTTAAAWILAMKNEDLNGTHGWLGKTHWRFPTQNDLAGLYQALGLSGQEPVVPVPDTTLDGFEDIQPYLYWSCAGLSIRGSCSGVASPGPGPPSKAFQWNFSFGNGFQGTTHVGGQMYAMVYYPNAPTPTPTPKPPKPPCKPPKPGAPSTCT
jgi:hypothetical protein